MDRLLRFQARKFGLSEPPTHLAKKVMLRNMSPAPARSILMMLAPMSPSSCVANGPCSRWLKSRMRDAFKGLVHVVSLVLSKAGRERSAARR